MMGPLSANSWLVAIWSVLLAGAACASILFVLLKTGLAWRLATDIPNERSLHVRPTPRVGGWGIVPVSLFACLTGAPKLWPLAFAFFFLAVVSYVDDRRGLSARIRFLAHTVAALVIVGSYGATLSWLVQIVVVLVCVWFINLYNFMDGADGLAAGMTGFGFGAYAIAALTATRPDLPLAWASSAVAGAALGFLWFNFHPARIFLGDVGSISTGFLAVAFGFYGWSHDVWPIWFAPLVFAPFIGDASVTLVRRLAGGERFWVAHREHYYQRMIRTGIGHARTACMWYVFMCLGMVIALSARTLPLRSQLIVISVWLVILVIAGVGIDMRWRTFRVRENPGTTRDRQC